MAAKIIPYSTQWIDSKDIKAVVKTLKSPWLTQGPNIQEFEMAVARYLGVKNAVAVNSGTAALLAACFAAGISEGDEGITTPYTFVATANAIVWFGAKPVFVDIDNNTFNINPNKIEAAITKKTKAIVAVDFAGMPCDYDLIMKIAKRHNLIVIDDASHSLGSEYRGRKIGSISDLTIFSFHPVKQITTGEGGMITTNNKSFYEKLLLFRNHGIEKSGITEQKSSWHYQMKKLGLNLRLTSFQAALGLSQLKKINEFITRRRQIVKIYNSAFSNLPVVAPHETTDSKSAWQLYPVRLKLNKLRENRKVIFDDLRKAGLGVQVHFIPVHLHPYYRQKFKFSKKDFPIAEAAYEAEISLPLYPKMADADINFVINTFQNVIKKYQK